MSRSLMPMAGSGTSSSHSPASRLLLTSAFIISPTGVWRPNRQGTSEGSCLSIHPWHSPACCLCGNRVARDIVENSRVAHPSIEIDTPLHFEQSVKKSIEGPYH